MKSWRPATSCLRPVSPLLPPSRQSLRNSGIRATKVLSTVGEGLSDETRNQMYKGLDIIAENMKRLAEKGFPS